MTEPGLLGWQNSDLTTDLQEAMSSYICLHSFVHPISSAKERYIDIESRLVLCNQLKRIKSAYCWASFAQEHLENCLWSSYIGLHPFVHPIFSTKDRYIKIKPRLVIFHHLTTKKNKSCFHFHLIIDTTRYALL